MLDKIKAVVNYKTYKTPIVQSIDWYFLAGKSINGRVFDNYLQLASTLIASVHNKLISLDDDNANRVNITIFVNAKKLFILTKLVKREPHSYDTYPHAIAIEDSTSKVELPLVPDEVKNLFEQTFFKRNAFEELITNLEPSSKFDTQYIIEVPKRKGFLAYALPVYVVQEIDFNTWLKPLFEIYKL